jgi:hypothetical protein
MSLVVSAPDAVLVGRSGMGDQMFGEQRPVAGDLGQDLVGCRPDWSAEGWVCCPHLVLVDDFADPLDQRMRDRGIEVGWNQVG